MNHLDSQLLKLHERRNGLKATLEEIDDELRKIKATPKEHFKTKQEKDNQHRTALFHKGRAITALQEINLDILKVKMSIQSSEVGVFSRFKNLFK